MSYTSNCTARHLQPSYFVADSASSRTITSFVAVVGPLLASFIVAVAVAIAATATTADCITIAAPCTRSLRCSHQRRLGFHFPF